MRSGKRGQKRGASQANRSHSIARTGSPPEPGDRQRVRDAIIALYRDGRYAEVVTLAQAMTHEAAHDAFGWKLLGPALSRLDRHHDALAAARRAAALSPQDAECHDNLGQVLSDLGRLDESVPCYVQALAIRPDFARANTNLGNALMRLRQTGAAMAAYRRALATDPTLFEAHYNLGNALKELGRHELAAASYRQSLALRGTSAEAHRALGNCLVDLGRLDESLGHFHAALRIRPAYGQAHNSLGNALRQLGRYPAAAEHLRTAVALSPHDADAHNNLGITHKALGQLEPAVASLRQALAIRPDFAKAHSNLLFCLSHDESVTPEALFAEHLAFGDRFEAPWRTSRPGHANTVEPDRALRVGFVSGDLRNHSVARFIGPVLAALDRDALQVWLYSNHAGEDAMTHALRALGHGWRTVAGASDDALAAQIRADAIDVLFDLSGHTAYNRLLTFARKPAPVQVTWIGYPNTTGLRAMDYVLCDRFNAPHGRYEHYYVEKFARLPSSGTFAAVTPAPAVSALPAQARGFVTFGSFSSAARTGDRVIATWSQVLQAVPGSRLLLGNVSGPGQAREFAERFARHGIAPQRLDFRPFAPLADYLALHHEVDIILDTWPYSGGTTSNHALWMGVPVLTLLGPARAHCQSAAVMGRLGLSDWVANDVDEFVRLAVRHAGALPALAQLRAGMRARWHAAPLRQPATVARGLERAVRRMWQRWCAGQVGDHFEIGDLELA